MKNRRNVTPVNTARPALRRILEGKVIYRFWIGFLTGGLFLRLIAIGVEEIEKIRAGASCKMKMFCIGSKD
jgi:hypothetical protein